MWLLPVVVGILALLAGCALKPSVPGPAREIVVKNLAEGQIADSRPTTLLANRGTLTPSTLEPAYEVV